MLMIHVKNLKKYGKYCLFFFPFYRRQALFYDEINDTWQQSSAEALLSSCCREVKNSRLGEKKVSG